MELVINVAIIFIIGISITYFEVKSGCSAQEGELRFGLFIKSLGLICLLISSVAFVVLLTENYNAEKFGETTALIGLIVSFGVGAFYVLLDAFFVKGNYDQKSIYFSTPWTGIKNEKWCDIKSVTYNSACSWHVLKFNSGKIIRISSYLGGSGYLIESLST